MGWLRSGCGVGKTSLFLAVLQDELPELGIARVLLRGGLEEREERAAALCFTQDRVPDLSSSLLEGDVAERHAAVTGHEPGSRG